MVSKEIGNKSQLEMTHSDVSNKMGLFTEFLQKFSASALALAFPGWSACVPSQSIRLPFLKLLDCYSS